MDFTFGPTGRVTNIFREVTVDMCGTLPGTATIDSLDVFGTVIMDALKTAGVITPVGERAGLLVQQGNQLSVRFSLLARTDRGFREAQAAAQACIVTSTSVVEAWLRLCDLPCPAR